MIKHLFKNQELFREKRVIFTLEESTNNFYTNDSPMSIPNAGAEAAPAVPIATEGTETAQVEIAQTLDAPNNIENIKQNLFGDKGFNIDDTNLNWGDANDVQGGLLKDWLTTSEAGTAELKGKIGKYIEDLQKFYNEKNVDKIFSPEDIKAFSDEITKMMDVIILEKEKDKLAEQKKEIETKKTGLLATATSNPLTAYVEIFTLDGINKEQKPIVKTIIAAQFKKDQDKFGETFKKIDDSVPAEPEKADFATLQKANEAIAELLKPVPESYGKYAEENADFKTKVEEQKTFIKNVATIEERLKIDSAKDGATYKQVLEVQRPKKEEIIKNLSDKTDPSVFNKQIDEMESQLVMAYLRDILVKANTDESKKALEGLDILGDKGKTTYGLGQYAGAKPENQVKIKALFDFIKKDPDLKNLIKIGFEGSADVNTFDLTSAWSGTYDKYAEAAVALFADQKLKNNRYVAQNLKLIEEISKIKKPQEWDTFAKANKGNTSLTGANGALNTILAYMRVKNFAGTDSMKLDPEIKLTVGNLSGDRYALAFTHNITEAERLAAAEAARKKKEEEGIWSGIADFNQQSDSRVKNEIDGAGETEKPVAQIEQGKNEKTEPEVVEINPAIQEQLPKFDFITFKYNGSNFLFKINKDAEVKIDENAKTITIIKNKYIGGDKDSIVIRFDDLSSIQTNDVKKYKDNSVAVIKLPDNYDKKEEDRKSFEKGYPQDNIKSIETTESREIDALFYKQSLEKEQVKSIVAFYNLKPEPKPALTFTNLQSFKDVDQINELAKYSEKITFKNLQKLDIEQMEALLNLKDKVEINESLFKNLLEKDELTKDETGVIVRYFNNKKTKELIFKDLEKLDNDIVGELKQYKGEIEFKNLDEVGKDSYEKESKLIKELAASITIESIKVSEDYEKSLMNQYRKVVLGEYSAITLNEISNKLKEIEIEGLDRIQLNRIINAYSYIDMNFEKNFDLLKQYAAQKGNKEFIKEVSVDYSFTTSFGNFIDEKIKEKFTKENSFMIKIKHD